MAAQATLYFLAKIDTEIHRTYLGAAEKGRLSVEDVDVPAPDESVNGSAQNLVAKRAS